MSHSFQTFLQSIGIVSQRSCPSNPQQNGMIERKNCYLLDVVRTLLLESFVPSQFWCETLSTVVHLINKLSSSSLNHVSPFTQLFGRILNYFNFVLLVVCFVHFPAHEHIKLTAQSIQCLFLGYSVYHKGFFCNDPNLSCIRVSKNMTFFEN